jgi:17beta-estradiol 17-dehydrogenase / very-long-chain 3-oxoacyl-CoA reductase
VETKVIVYDFADLSSEEQINRLKEKLEIELKGLDVSVLANNVGMAKSGKFHEVELRDYMAMTNVNINSQVYMTLFILPKMLQRKSRSAVINVSSIAHYEPWGPLAMYAATKSFNYNFGLNLAASYPKQIDVLTVTPGSVATQMNSGKWSFSVTAPEHGKAVIDQLGWTKLTYGSWNHAIRPYIRHTPILNFFSMQKDAKVFAAMQKAAKK